MLVGAVLISEASRECVHDLFRVVITKVPAVWLLLQGTAPRLSASMRGERAKR